MRSERDDLFGEKSPTRPKFNLREEGGNNFKIISQFLFRFETDQGSKINPVPVHGGSGTQKSHSCELPEATGSGSVRGLPDISLCDAG